MKGKVRKLWIKALKGDNTAYRSLGILLLRGRGCQRDKIAAGLCLRKAMEAGDEQGYLLYHRLFSKGRKVIDDASYIQIYQEYRKSGNRREKKRFGQYLALGTKRQKWLVTYNDRCKKEERNHGRLYQNFAGAFRRGHHRLHHQ